MTRPRAILRDILQLIARCRSCCVVGHLRPDGDCVGSQLALTLALEQRGKSVHCWNHDPLPHKLAFLDPDRRLTRPHPGRTFDLVVAVDCASLERLGDARRALRPGTPLINIDHHASNTLYGQLNWITEDEPSTGELIYQLIRYAGWTITPAIADNLYTAISTDTGSFQYPSTRPSTLETAADLVKRGASLARISEEVYQSSPLPRVYLLRELYKRFRLAHHNRIATFYLRQSDYDRTGADRADTEGLIDHLRDIEPVVVACLFEEVSPQVTRISLRSKHPGLDVNAVAARFGGGGHRAAAGARIEGPPATVQRRVLAALKQAVVALTPNDRP